MPRKPPENAGSISAQAQQDLVSEGIENFELPKSLVTKIAKSAVPENTKLQKETILSLVKGSTVFINYLAATAHDVALSKQHKSISASDVLKALEVLELGDMTESLQAELQIYRELAKSDKTKKGTSNVNSAVAPSKAKASTSISAAQSAPGTRAPAKGKEREKASNHNLPPPFTSVPLAQTHLGESISTGPRGIPMDVDDGATEEGFAEEPEVLDGAEGDMEGVEDEIDEEEDEDEEDEEEGDDAEEEIVDTIAVEEEELRKEPPQEAVVP